MNLRLRVKGGGSTNYAYAVARVQAKRSRLVKTQDYPKFLEMDVSEITRFLEDSAYKAEVDELASRFTGLDLLENALTINAERTFHSVRRLVAGEGGAIVNQFLARFLVDDLKAVLRGKTAGATREELLQELLVEDLDTYNIFQPLLAADIQTPAAIHEALTRQGGVAAHWGRVLAAVPEGSPASRYEDALDQAYYADLVGLLADSREPGADVLGDLVAREIDVRNIVNAARWVAGGQGGDFADHVIGGGRQLRPAEVIALASLENLQAFADALAEKGMPDATRDAAAALVEHGRLARFQAALWQHHMQRLDTLAHGNPLSLLPILGFIIRKQQEVGIIRAVARGKAAGLSRARLEELIS